VKSKFDTDAQARGSSEKQNVCWAGPCHKRDPAIAIARKTTATQVNFEGSDIVCLHRMKPKHLYNKLTARLGV
jgi:hypothetical protein